MNVEVSREVLEEVEHITSTIPGKVFYSEDGEALILADNDTYIISVTPPSVILEGFNNGNCTTNSAYLISQPAELTVCESWEQPEIDEIKGWSTGWEC